MPIHLYHTDVFINEVFVKKKKNSYVEAMQLPCSASKEPAAERMVTDSPKTPCL